MPGIPSALSDVVLTGLISDAQAHLSNDKTGIYSEFAVVVGEVLKGDVNKFGRTITMERFGGAVRFSSGRIQKYESDGQGMPRVGSQYVLFLKRLDQEDFKLLTAYELRDDRVIPLDGSRVEMVRWIVRIKSSNFPDKNLGQW